MNSGAYRVPIIGFSFVYAKANLVRRKVDLWNYFLGCGRGMLRKWSLVPVIVCLSAKHKWCAPGIA